MTGINPSGYDAAGSGNVRRNERLPQNGGRQERLERNDRLFPGISVGNPNTEARSPSLSNRANHIPIDAVPDQPQAFQQPRRQPKATSSVQGAHLPAGYANRRPDVQALNEPIYQQAGFANNIRANNHQVPQPNIRMPRVVVGREEKQVISVVALAILGVMILPSLIKLAITVGTVIFIARYLIGNRNNLEHV